MAEADRHEPLGPIGHPHSMPVCLRRRDKGRFRRLRKIAERDACIQLSALPLGVLQPEIQECVRDAQYCRSAGARTMSLVKQRLEGSPRDGPEWRRSVGHEDVRPHVPHVQYHGHASVLAVFH